MKTAIDLSIEFYKVLNTPELTNLISGQVFKGKIPEAFQDRENVATNTIFQGGGQLQTGAVNVNIHVPDIVHNAGGLPFTGANDERLNQISKVVLGILEVAEIDGIPFEIQSITTMQEREMKQHFVNIRIITYSPNLK